MQIVGYMILLVFYLCYFIKMFQQRKQGIQTDHMGKGKQGIQKKIEIMMKGATIATFIIEILSIYLNTTTFPLIIRIMGIRCECHGKRKCHKFILYHNSSPCVYSSPYYICICQTCKSRLATFRDSGIVHFATA